MKKLWKILGIVAATLLVVLLVIVFLVLRALPSPSEIGRVLRPANVRSALKTAETQKNTPAPEAASSGAEAPSPETASGTGSYQIGSKSQEDRAVLDDIMNPKNPLADFCRYLRNASQEKNQNMSLTEFGQKFKQSATTEDKDPVIQAIKPSLRFVFGRPQMRALVDEALAAVERGEEADTLMSKTGFYAQAYSAFRELQQSRPRIEAVMDRSYELMIMSRVIAQKPELLSDNGVFDYCRSIENAINGEVPLMREQEVAEFQKFIADSGVDPKSVGYDPGYRTRLEVTYGATGVHMKGGWIDSVLKPTQQELRSIESQAKKPGK